ncbi:MAG TPA: hypothetical protein VKT30_10265 [Caulobacteraceae bacterium]|nr:hypothetical protein [Caulobacteraceae bacterium]
MIEFVPGSPADPQSTPLDLDGDDLLAERLAAEGWPVLRGSERQRDARFVKAVLKAQLALMRGGR